MIKIYINYFDESRVVESEVLTPIQVGRAISRKKLNMLGDDEGENISKKNPAYCELTGQYWVWKNDTSSEYIGFMHYRRFLDFYPDREREGNTIHGIVEKNFYDGFLEEYGLVDERITALVRGYDIIVPEPFDLSSVRCRSIEHQYKIVPNHYAKDFDVARRVFREMYPDSIKYFEMMAASKLFFPTNIFIFKREIFWEYCQWLFPLLERIEMAIDVSGYSAQEKRVIGYLAERLFTAFLLQKIDTSPEVRVKKLRRIFVENTKPAPAAPPLPNMGLPVVSVVASTDAAYLPHIGALIVSVLKNAHKKVCIDFVVLDGGLSEHDRCALVALEKLHPYCKIGFVDMSQEFMDVDVHSYFSRSTFFRLAMPNILKNRSKVLFLDTDMIVLGDVKEIFEIDLSDKIVAGVRDLIMKSFCAMGVRSSMEVGGQPANIYLSDCLGMRSKIGDYFQAGTILLDLEKIRSEFIGERMIHDLRAHRYWFLDQDVLNKHLMGKVKFIDHCWNAVPIDERHREYLTKEELSLYESSQSMPKIIHYAGPSKPWDNSDNALGHYYWYYLRQTPWYEKVFFRYLEKNRVLPSFERKNEQSVINMVGQSWKRKLLSGVWRALPDSMRSMMWPVAIRMAQMIK